MLYPPYIEGTIPSFYGDSLTVPFSMNKSVGVGEVQGFSLKLKTIQNTKYLFTTSKVLEQDLSINQYVIFDISSYTGKLKVGQHYKVQIAYIGSNGEVGYYSTVGIIKYTKKPSVTIDGLKIGKINQAAQNYIGTYSQENGDTTEKEYKYRFIFTDKSNNVLKDTEWQIHNNQNDDKNYVSHDEFLMPFELVKGETYYIQYSVITNNKLEVNSIKYRIGQQASIEAENEVTLTAEMNQDNGYVKLTMEGEYNTDSGEELSLTGAFLITRACEDTNFTEWNEISRFKTKSIFPSNWSYKDFTVQQGKEYIYAFQQYNDFDLYSDKILSNKLFVDFEDIFLYDGKKQLKVSYNPQVSSFKTDVLESKTETIGSKYPFFFRNGTVEYKEFSLNGLISYLSDEEHLFMTNAEMGLSPRVEKLTRSDTVKAGFTPDDAYYYEQQMKGVNVYNLQKSYANHAADEELLETERFRTTQLTGFNISAERTFKLKVLEWLNNGEPKLFRSPGEGNYIVRLMNVSLSPEDTLGRMLHNFSCTAYEIDDYNYDNLLTYGITNSNEQEYKILRFKSVLVKDYLDQNWIDKDYAVSLRLENFQPGDKVYINTGENKLFVIGATGNYQINTETKIYSVKFDESTLQKYKNQTLNSPMVTFSYYDASTNVFNEITSIDFEDTPVKQYIGDYDNIVPGLNDIKRSLLTFYYLHFLKRDIVETSLDSKGTLTETDPYPLYKVSMSTLGGVTRYKTYPVDKQLFKDLSDKKIFYIKSTSGDYILAQSWNENSTYYIIEDENEVYLDLNKPDVLIVSEEDYEYLSNYFTEDEMKDKFLVYDTCISIDGNIMDLSDTLEYSIGEAYLYNSIELTVGTVLECGFSTRIVNYSIEKDNKDLINLKAKLDALRANVKAYREAEKKPETKYTAEDYYNLYNEYITLLTKLKAEEDL